MQTTKGFPGIICERGINNTMAKRKRKMINIKKKYCTAN